MCHVLKVDTSRVEVENGWIIGYKAVDVDENGVYKAPFVSTPYNFVQLSDGVLLYDLETKPHPGMIMLGRPVSRNIDIEVPPGLHA